MKSIAIRQVHGNFASASSAQTIHFVIITSLQKVELSIEPQMFLTMSFFGAMNCSKKPSAWHQVEESLRFRLIPSHTNRFLLGDC